MRILYTTVMLFALGGCATTPKLTGTQLVNVPISTKCSPTLNITDIPEYPTDKMTKDMSLFEKFQLVWSERSLLKGQNTELKAALGECTK